jgi:hypothetical protein
MGAKPDDVTALLWADDDSRGSLEPLGRRLKRNRFTLEDAIDFCEAVEKLKSLTHFDALLLDIILPFAQGAGALEFDLGIRLATEAPGIHGTLRNVAFLTVVQPGEVSDKYRAVEAQYAGKVRFEYFDKTKLLEPYYLDRITQFLRQK